MNNEKLRGDGISILRVLRVYTRILKYLRHSELCQRFYFSCEGNFASSRIYRSESDGNMNFIQKPDASVIIQGEFSLKSLSHFIKCTPLCSHLEMYLGNDLPLIIKYDVASLGSIKLCLAALPPT